MLMQLLALAAKAGGWIRLLVVPVPVVAALRRRFIVGGADLRLPQGDAGLSSTVLARPATPSYPPGPRSAEIA